MNDMKTNIVYFLISFALLLQACEQLEVDNYENDPRLYFYHGSYTINHKTFTQRDSTEHSFFTLSDDQLVDTVWVDIRTMGLLEHQARPMKIVQVNTDKPNAAVAGKHYFAFDSDEMKEHMYMPANRAQCFWPVIVKRDPSLENSRVRLEMAIIENDYFKPGVDTLARFMVTTTGQAQKPSLWNSYWKYSYGEWGSKKMWFLVNYVGIRDFNSYISDSGLDYYYQAKAREELKKYNADESNPDRPLKEADGTIVTFD